MYLFFSFSVMEASKNFSLSSNGQSLWDWNLSLAVEYKEQKSLSLLQGMWTPIWKERSTDRLIRSTEGGDVVRKLDTLFGRWIRCSERPVLAGLDRFPRSLSRTILVLLLSFSLSLSLPFEETSERRSQPWRIFSLH